MIRQSHRAQMTQCTFCFSIEKFKPLFPYQSDLFSLQIVIELEENWFTLSEFQAAIAIPIIQLKIYIITFTDIFYAHTSSTILLNSETYSVLQTFSTRILVLAIFCSTDSKKGLCWSAAGFPRLWPVARPSQKLPPTNWIYPPRWLHETEDLKKHRLSCLVSVSKTLMQCSWVDTSCFVTLSSGLSSNLRTMTGGTWLSSGSERVSSKRVFSPNSCNSLLLNRWFKSDSLDLELSIFFTLRTK